MSLEFVRAVESDIERIDRFNTIGGDRWVSEFWNPNGPSGILYIAVDREIGVVGVEGYVPYDLIGPHGSVPSHRSERTLVSPSQRGKGVFGDLIEHCDADAEEAGSMFCWGSTSALKPFSKSGFEACTGWREYIFTPNSQTFSTRRLRSLFSVDWRRAFRGLRRGALWSDRMVTLGAVSLLLPRRKSNTTLTARPATPGEVEDSLICERAASEGNIVFPVNRNTESWMSSIGVRNELLLIRNGDRVVGYAALSEDRAGLPSEVADFYVDASVSSSQGLTAVLGYISKSRVTTCTVTTFNAKNKTHHRILGEMPAYTSVRIKKRGSFVLKALSGNSISMEDLLVTGRWFQL